jgi:hypothetical protein
MTNVGRRQGAFGLSIVRAGTSVSNLGNNILVAMSSEAERRLAELNAAPEEPVGPPRATPGETANRRKEQKAKQRARGKNELEARKAANNLK